MGRIPTLPAERVRRLEAFARRRSIELEGAQDAFLRESGPGREAVDGAITRAARDVKAARKARRR